MLTHLKFVELSKKRSFLLHNALEGKPSRVWFHSSNSIQFVGWESPCFFFSCLGFSSNCSRVLTGNILKKEAPQRLTLFFCLSFTNLNQWFSTCGHNSFGSQIILSQGLPRTIRNTDICIPTITVAKLQL